MKEADQLQHLPLSAKEISVYESGNEALFFWESRLRFRFKATVSIECTEINNLLRARALTELLDIRETRYLGWTFVRQGAEGLRHSLRGHRQGFYAEGYTIFTLTEVLPAPEEEEISCPATEIWPPGRGLADHENCRIYISRFNRPHA